MNIYHKLYGSLCVVCSLVIFSATAAQAMVCTLNGHTVQEDCFKNNYGCGQDTGRMVCTQVDKPFGAWDIKQGKHIGYEELYDYMGGKTVQSVDMEGKIDGTSKKYSSAGILIMERDYAHGKVEGQDRDYFPDGKPEEISWWENGHEVFNVAYDKNGHPRGLSCGPKPYVSEAKDLCGFNGKASLVELSIPGSPDKVRTVSYLNGALVSDTLGERGNGLLMTQESVIGDTTVKKDYFPDGKLQTQSSYKNGRLDGLETEYHDGGQTIRETLWEKGDKIREDLFYLNGQKKSHQDFIRQGDQWLVSETAYFDNGQKESEGTYLDDLPIHEHRSYNESGKLVMLDVYDDQGHIQREKKWDDNGKLLSDDAVFEDGSRKSFSTK